MNSLIMPFPIKRKPNEKTTSRRWVTWLAVMTSWSCHSFPSEKLSATKPFQRQMHSSGSTQQKGHLLRIGSPSWPFCCLEAKNNSQILLHCSYSWNIRTEFLNKLEQPWSMAQDKPTLLKAWNSPKNDLVKNTWNVLPALKVWQIWKGWNQGY